MNRTPFLIAIVAAACGDSSGPSGPASSTAGGRCESDVIELKAFLTTHVSPGSARAKPPWPTGEASRDRMIESARSLMRDYLRSSDLAEAMALLTSGDKTGVVDAAFADCRQARQQFYQVEVSRGDARQPSLMALADAVASCACAVDLPLVRALIYLVQRGPD